MEEGKKWFLSKTLWVNLIMGLVAFFSAIFPEASVLAKINTEMLVSIFAGVNMLLRFVTKDALEFK